MARSRLARAPGRINLIGEHTDYNGGLCLPTALPHDTLARVTERPDGEIHLRSAQQPDPWVGTLDDCGPGGPGGWVAYAVGVLWALREDGYDVPPGLDVEVSSTVPLGAGLSSSASLEVAVAVAVHALTGDPAPPLDDAGRRRLVEVCRRAETEVVGAPTGGLDQSASLLCAAGSALLLDFDDGSSRRVPLALEDAGLVLTVIDTRVSHELTDGGYGDRRGECERAAAALGVPSLRHTDAAAVEGLGDELLRRRARHVVTENDRVRATVAALDDPDGADWSAVGSLLDASHASLRDDFEVSCAELDLAVAAAVGAGALGSRMTGGGFGGSAIALVPVDRLGAVRAAVDEAFHDAGHRAPRHLDGTPSGPASRVASVDSPR